MSGLRRLRWMVVGMAVAVVALAGCGDEGSEQSATTTSAGDPTPTTVPDPAAPDLSATDPVDQAAWQTIEIKDTAGETFTLADLAGRPVLVENFATWCSNCRSQLEDTQSAAKQAGDGAVFVALSVETELDLEDMARYQEDNGFTDIRFAVMSPELLAAMDEAFGASALNPPSTPKIAIAADGTAGELVTGQESPEEILSALGLG